MNDEMIALTADDLKARMEQGLLPTQVLWDNNDTLQVVLLTAFVKGWATIEWCADVGAPVQTAKVRASDLYPFEETASESGGKMAKVLAKYRMGYMPSVAASGKKSLHNGDPVAKALEYRELEWLYNATADLMQVPVAELKLRYAHLNPGSQRMNLGNRIRAAYRRGDEHIVDWVNSVNNQ